MCLLMFREHKVHTASKVQFTEQIPISLWYLSIEYLSTEVDL